MSKIVVLVGVLCLFQLACAGNIKKYEDLFSEFTERFRPYLDAKSDDEFTNFVKDEAKSFSKAYGELFNRFSTQARSCDKADAIVQPIIGKLLERANEANVTELVPGTELFNDKMQEGMTILTRKYKMIQDGLNNAGDDISADLKDTVKQIIDLTEQTGKRIADKKAELRP